MCSQKRFVEMPSPTMYHEKVINQAHMMQHRNNQMLCQQQDSSNQFEYDEGDDQRNLQLQYPQYHVDAFSFNPPPQHQAMNESQQQADQQSIELKMNNLGNDEVR